MIRAFQWDLARQVERLDVLVALLPKYSDWGYQELYLHLEDAVEYPSLPGVARPDAYSTGDIERLVSAAGRVGIGVVPIVNLLGHTQYLIKVPGLRDLNELRADDGSPLPSGQLCPLHPRTPEIAGRLLDDMRPFCTAGKVHVGLDESFHLARCPRCRAEVAAVGLATHFARHVQRLHTLTTQRGLRLGMWADMLNFVPEAIPQLPSGIVAYDWYYYPFRRHPKVELFNFAEADLATPLKQQGIDYWGCPMNGAFRFEPLPLFRDRLANLRSWWKRCERVGAGGFLVTSWEAYRLALETTTVVDAAAASFWRGNTLQAATLSSRTHRPTAASDASLLAAGFQRAFSLPAAAARRHAQAALAADKYPFSGYAAWEVNDRWDLRAGLSRSREVSRPARALDRLAAGAEHLHPALAASLRFRAYLAAREHFVAESADRLFAARRRLARGGSSAEENALVQITALLAAAERFGTTLAAGRTAARAMWRRTRAPSAKNQNAEILAKDAVRLRALRVFLRACRRRPERLREANPVCGAWQLTFTVRNIAPALQRISVECQDKDGAWHELHGRHSIEFQADAAERRADIARAFSVPVPAHSTPLRLVLRGLGLLVVEDFRLTDGVVSIPLGVDGKRRLRLGRPAPTVGFPDVRQLQDTHLLTPQARRRRSR